MDIKIYKIKINGGDQKSAQQKLTVYDAKAGFQMRDVRGRCVQEVSSLRL